MPASRILVLDDDSVARRLLETSLTAEGFVVHAFGTMTHARAAFAREPYDLYLLDIVLPDGNGLEMCGLIRQRSHSPIIMLTVKGDLGDVVEGLEAGADDYVSKPFRMQEVVARIRAQLRRAERKEQGRESTVRVGDLVVDRDARDAVLNGKALRLSPREFEILDLLASRDGRSASRETIIETIWGEQEDLSDKILAVYVRRLRCKIEENPDQPQYLHTIRGFGYRLAAAGDVTQR
ncbi:MAG TPA: response regulator transcription factor [Thermoanaerobaculia bacterium]|nr:response regulator transcription factor [Thermoanaerobaculia bacterium]